MPDKDSPMNRADWRLIHKDLPSCHGRLARALMLVLSEF